MRTILCYGDSNTWGADPSWTINPEGHGRFPRDIRWPGVLELELGDGYRVIEEGLKGRTTVWKDPIEGAHLDGSAYLLPCLESHQPLDLVVLMLGTNDLKNRFSLSATDIAKGASRLAGTILSSNTGSSEATPKVLLVAPPPLGELTDFAEMFEGAEQKSRNLSKYYRQFAKQIGCAFLDASGVIISSDIDGIHFEASEHAKLGEAVAARAREMLDEGRDTSHDRDSR